MTDNSPHSDPSRNLPVAASQAYGPSALVVGGGRHTAPPQPGEPESVPWARYADALRRHWWIVVLVTLLGIGVGFFLKRRALPEYRADATIWITRANNAQDRGPIRTEQLLGTSSWEGLVRSYGIIYPVIRRLSLNISFKSQADSALARAFSLDSTFQPGIYRLEVDTLGKTYSLSAEERGVVARGTVGDSIGRQQLGFIWSPPASLLTPRRVVEFSVTSLRATAQGLNSKLTTNIPGEDGQFMVLSLSGTNPRRVAATLNAWVREFVTTATALKKGKLGLQQDAMARQLAVVTQQLGTAETDLQRFRERNATLMPDNAATGGNPGFFQLQYQRDAVQRDRAALERILRAARDSAGGAVAPEAFLAVPGVLTGPGSAQLNAAISALTVAQSELEAARRSFTDSSDFVLKAVEKRDALAKVTIPGIVTEIIASLKNQEQGFSTQIDTMSRELRAVPARALDEQRLRRNYAQSEQLFMQMKAAYDQVRLTDLQTTPDLTIQDPAEAPLSPTSNPGNRLFILAVMASIAAGVGLALVRDRLDRHFRHPEQATLELGLTVIGTVPKFRTNRRGELSVTAMSQVVESFRALRLSVRHHFPLDQPVVLCVSSPGAGEGKSLVCSNLAIAFANSGHKTLLIDGDVRRGVVHATFDMPRRPGLVDFLGGAVAQESVIRATSTENLSVITSGARSRKAPELLVSDHMAALVADMRRQFEVVIIDSAPFAAGMDSYALGAAAGAMVVVLRPGVTDRRLAATKLDILDRLPVVVIGAVLNGISGTGAYRYYYSEYSEYAIEDVDDDQKDEGASIGPRLIGPA